MNRQDARKLSAIQAPPEMLKKLIKTEKTFAETKDRIDQLYNSRKLTMKERNKVAELRDNPQWERESKTVDPNVAKRIEKDIEGKIAHAIRSGALPPPKFTDKERERIDKYYGAKK